MRINTGWLLENETELRLNFHNHPLRIFSKYKTDDEKKKRYAITIKPFKIDNDEHLTEVHDYLHTLRVSYPVWMFIQSFGRNFEFDLNSTKRNSTANRYLMNRKHLTP